MKRFFRANYFAIIMFFIYAPIVMMIIFSFNSGSTVFSWQGFSFKWYKDLMNNSPFIKSIITSLFVAVVSTTISLFIGVSAAIGLSRSKKMTQVKWLTVSNVPLINADIVTAVSLMLVFLMSGVHFGIFTLIMAHVSFNVPYVLIIVMPRLRKIDHSLIEAGLDLGANPAQLLFRVILPVLKPAIISAAAIAFAMSFDDFIISYFTGGSQTNVASFIYTAKKIRPYIFAFGTIFVFLLIIAIASWNAVSIYKQQKAYKVYKIKNDLYKVKELSQLTKDLQRLEAKLKTGSKTIYSNKPYLWLKYWKLKLQIKIASDKNYDKKISKLEWKRQKISAKIRKEKNYATSLTALEKRLAKYKDQLTKTTNVNKAALLTLQIEFLEQQLEDIHDEIELIENREEIAAKKIAKINTAILEHQKNLRELKKPSKHLQLVIKRRIKRLEDAKIELEEGKNNYRLRLIVERLRELQHLNYNNILLLNEKKLQLESQLFIEKPFTFKIDTLIVKTANPKIKKQLKKQRAELIQKIETFLIAKINRKNAEIAKLRAHVEMEKHKLTPNYDEGSTHRTHNFLIRSWKGILVGCLWIAAFSGLTVAYIINNTYDLVIGNWGQYIDPVLLGDFEREFKVKVNYQEYDSNETLYNKLYTFDYDLMVPSDYMVQKLAQEDRLELLDYRKINVNNTWDAKTPTPPEAEKVDFDEYLVELLKNYHFEVEGDQKTLLDYSVPYLWGDLVIVVNPKPANLVFLQENDIAVDATTGLLDQTKLSWDLLWKAAKGNYNLVLNDDPKNIFMLAAQKLSQKVNLNTKSEIDAAYQELKQLLLNRNISLNNDEITTTVGKGMFDFAVMYNGDAVEASIMAHDEDGSKFLFGRPNVEVGERYQTTNIFSDNLVISKYSGHKELAYAFINFFLKNARTIGEYVGVPSPDKEAMTELTTGAGKFKDHRRLYYPAVSVTDDPTYKYQINGTESLAYSSNAAIDEYLVEQYNKLLAERIFN